MDLEVIKKEMEWSISGKGEEKDILLVVRDGYEYVKNCVESIFKHTKCFKLLIWDNASSEETSKYLESLGCLPGVRVVRSETNEGFVVPNNRLFAQSDSKWVILLNSDTEVLPMWDELMIGVLKENEDIKQVGYLGGLVDENCNVSGCGVGRDVDYISGHCFCMERKCMQNFGPFDETNIKFAYCEDSDLSFRIREKGWGIYACHSDGMVRHYGGRTSSSVMKEDDRLEKNAKENFLYMKSRWKPFLDLYRMNKVRYNRRS